ncbi:hypothetical protein Tco_1325240, partial [Tanacetum coccineum]
HVSPYFAFTILQRASMSSVPIPYGILIIEEYLLELPSALLSTDNVPTSPLYEAYN